MAFAVEIAMNAQSGAFDFTHPAAIITGNGPVAFMRYVSWRFEMGGMHVMMFRASGVALRTASSAALSAHRAGMMIAGAGVVDGPCVA
jgi:hypothetical protein